MDAKPGGGSSLPSPLSENGNRQSPSRRRGRPPGSPSLTKEREERILALVRSGASPAAAAAAVGISPRTLRDLLARGEDRHPTRSCTPKLRRFARRFRQAQAETRIVAENHMFTHQTGVWLKRLFRATEDDEGWSDAPAGPGGPRAVEPSIQSLTDDELNAALGRLFDVVTTRKVRS